MATCGYCCFSVTQLCLTPWDPVDCSTPGFPVLHHLPEFAQSHAHWVSDAIQPSHPLSSPSPPAFSLSQHQGLFPVSRLFTASGQRIGVSASTSLLPMVIQDWFPLGWTGWISLHPKDSQESSPTPQLKSINSLAHSFLYDPALPSILDTGKTTALTRRTFVNKLMSVLFNMLSRSVIALLPRRKSLWISWLQSPSAVIWQLNESYSLQWRKATCHRLDLQTVPLLEPEDTP